MHPRPNIGDWRNLQRWLSASRACMPAAFVIALPFTRLVLRALQIALIVSAMFGIFALTAGEAEFRRDTLEAVRKAASTLGSSRYYEHLAELEPVHARAILRSAVSADPRGSLLWTKLGLVEERSEEARLAKDGPQGGRSAAETFSNPSSDFQFAREAFETAFRVDVQYAPAWALANFCFRRADQECFWRAASRAALRAPALEFASATDTTTVIDLVPLLDLASRVEPSPARVIERLSNSGGTPGTAAGAPLAVSLERAFLDDLIGKNQWDDAVTVARNLSTEPARAAEKKSDAAHLEALDMARLDDLVTRLIGVGRTSAAIQLWNDYSGFTALDPKHGLSLTNGDFDREPRGSGFDWRLSLLSPGSANFGRADSGGARPVPDGVETWWTPSQLEFRLTGEGPEQIQLAEQMLPLGRRIYRMRFDYATRGLPSPTGIRWVLASEGAAVSSPSLEPSMAWKSAQWSFSAPGESLAPLRLVYRRAPASARARGSLLLRRVRLEAL